MLILSILLNLLTPQQFPGKTVTVDFSFKRMWPGKPTLKYYYYDVTINNPTNELKYVIIPRWFVDEIQTSKEVSGAQYDSFEETTGSTLFFNTGSSFTIFTLAAKQKITLVDFTIETFSEDIEKLKSTIIPIIISKKIMIGTYVLEDFMKNEEMQDDNLECQLMNAATQNISIKLE